MLEDTGAREVRQGARSTQANPAQEDGPTLDTQDIFSPAPGQLRCEEALVACRTLVEAVPDLLLLVGLDGTVEYLNRAPGFTRDAVLGTSVVDYAPVELQEELRRSLGEIFDGAAPRVRELPAHLPDGTTRWFATHTAPVVREGRVVGATILARDVSDAKRAERALRESEARYRTLVENAPEAIVVLDVDAGHFVDANQNAITLFGLSREALLHSDPVTLSPPTQPDGQPSGSLARERIEAALGGEAPAFDWMHRTATGADVHCEVRLVRLPASDRRLVRGSLTDVTRQRQFDEHLRRWQRVEAVGQFASGIAHEFNNLLLVIGPSVDRLIEELAEAPALRLEAGWIKSAVERGTVLTNRLLAFSRREQSTHAEADLDTVMRDSTGLLGRLLSNGVRLVARLDAAGAVVACDRYELEQVLMNLVLNARDAMPAGGVVTVETSRIRNRFPREALNKPTPGSVVRLRVADTGVGMDDATRDRVFDAFFTTKPEGRGTGLGLSIASEIVRRAGGWLEVSSQVGVGSTFDVYLPEVRG